MASPLDVYRRAIQSIESSGNYGIVGPTHPKYGRALGAYQVMESNLPSWSKEAIGRSVSPDEFLGSKDIQDAIFNKRFGDAMAKNGNDPRQAASIWFTGRPINAASSASADSLGTTGSRYLAKFDKAVAGDTGDTQVAEADLPAAGASETAGPNPQSGFDAFMAGGPGALFGKPQEGWNAGDAMLGAGAALMARDNPKGAAALTAQMNGKSTTSNKMAVKVDPKTGQALVFDPQKGTFTTQQAFPRTPEADDPTDGSRKIFGENLNNANAHYDIADKFNVARQKIVNGDMDFSIFDRAYKTAAELQDKALTPQQRNAVQFAIDMEQMRNQILSTWKGVQTEGDAQRAMNMIMPGGFGGYNKDAILAAMERGYAQSVKSYDNSVRSNEALYNRYKDGIASRDYKDIDTTRRKYFTDEDAAYAPRNEAYRKSRDAENKPAPAASTNVPGRTVGNDNNNKPSSFYDHMKRGRQ